MSLLNNIKIGASGLNAASAGLSATSQNVVNSTTPGYQRRNVQQTTQVPTRVPSGIAGRGVTVTGFVRQGSELLTRQQIAGEGDFARSATQQRALQPMESLVDETQVSGPHATTTAFFDALQAATQDPSDAGLRRNVASRAKAVGRSIRTTAEGFESALDAQREGLQGGVDRLNGVARKLADVNRAIVAEDAPADLLDERDRLLKEAGSLVGATADIKHDGTANLLLDGHAVVSGPNPRTVSLTADFTLAVDVGSGTVAVSPGGEVGGLLDAATFTEGLQQTLADTAVALADAINSAHAGGFDASGTAGGNLFTYDAADPAGTLSIELAVDQDPGLLAFAGDASAAVGDADNLALMSDIETQALVGTQTVSASLTSLTTDLASEVARATSDADFGATVLSDLDGLQASLAGVDLDEEAANIMLFQTAYQASAKVVQVNDQLLGTLMEMT